MKKGIIGSAVLAVLLAACNSSKDANNDNFKQAIDAHLAKTCTIWINPFANSSDAAYPTTIELAKAGGFVTQKYADETNAKVTHQLDVLVEAGLLTVSRGTKAEKAMFGGGMVDVPTKIYNVTDAGKQALVNPGARTMCAGHTKVDDIVRFTAPDSGGGETVSQVVFTYSPVNVADWARRPDIQNAFNGLSNALVAHQTATRSVVLASDGWVDSQDFGVAR